ncbi:DMT family transporter [Selenihalanaerobacter shriftii]|uniref:Permease of the drug/metabolite transporter (DMT) superfamily n=1 Tax=Selenihalanaerobacter shriftii TaxID=142842 RepID=A0A1T4LWW7_9FIRM|nr:DMT family transporter [Selenihalanaerobacter shriftii]SJZ59172.1 Permease of the drug/metabolite transporter (DMT) superfamily [Selenihalanaerobacter shriftii]
MREHQIFTNKFWVPILAITACILWGTAFPFLKISYHELMIEKTDFFSKLLFASYRFFIASLILLGHLYFKQGKESLKVKKEFIKPLLILGLFQTTLQYSFFYNGLANTTGIKASILGTSGIFLTVVTSHFIYVSDKLNTRKILGLIVGFLGVLIVNINRGSFDFAFNFLGEGFILIAGTVSAVAAILAKDLANKIFPQIITGYQMLLGSLVLFLISITRVEASSLNFTIKTFSIMIYLAFVSAVGFGLWYTLIKYNSLGYISIYKFMIPVSGVLFSNILLVEENISINILIALLLVSIGIFIINFRIKKKNTKVLQE